MRGIKLKGNKKQAFSWQDVKQPSIINKVKTHQNSES